MKNLKSADLQLWDAYNKSKADSDQAALLRRMDPLIQNYVNKWQGNVPRTVLESQAKRLAANAFNTYNPGKGSALSTHVINNLAPISRTVYTYQNAARLPENISLKIPTFTNAQDHLVTTLGREPTTDELHQELGWSVPEINKLQGYIRKDLVESVGGLNDSFYGSSEREEEDSLEALYFSLTPEEKNLFEHTTGFHDKPILSNPDLCKQFGLSQAQLSYKKSLLRKKIDDFLGD